MIEMNPNKWKKKPNSTYFILCHCVLQFTNW